MPVKGNRVKLPKVNGKCVYGSWRDGSDIYKNKNGYYIVRYNKKTKSDQIKYLKAWKPNTMQKPKKESKKKLTNESQQIMKLKMKKLAKECMEGKVVSPITNRCVKNCPKGYIIRNSYTRTLKGKKTTVLPKCIKSQGLPGKTLERYQGPNKGIGPLKKGELSKHGYTQIKNLSKIKRHKYLNSAITEYGSSKILKKLGAVKTYQKNKSPEVSRILYDNMKWVRKKYDDDFKSSWKDSNLFK